MYEANGNALLSDPRDCPLPSLHTTKTKDHYKQKAYRVCLLNCLYKMLQNPSFFSFVEYITFKINLFDIPVESTTGSISFS